MLLTCSPVIYLALEICNGLLQQALEAMAQCIAVGSSKVSNVTMNGMRKLQLADWHMASLQIVNIQRK